MNITEIAISYGNSLRDLINKSVSKPLQGVSIKGVSVIIAKKHYKDLMNANP